MKVTSISFSSDKKLARCEQMFDYRYTQGLKPKLKSAGLWRGDWIHQLLEEYRNKRSWVKKFQELKSTVWDKLFDEQKEMYGEDFPEHIFNLFTHYTEHWATENESWAVLHIEKMFEIQTKIGVPVRFKSDLIVKEGKRTLLVENKNLKSLPESHERILSPQVHAYCFLLSKVGIKIDRIVWDYIRTEKVPSPQILKNGSLSKRKIHTDRRTYLAAMKKAGIHPKGDEVIGVENFLKELPETLSLLRIRNSVNLRVGELFVRDWIERHKRALAIKRPLRNFNRNCRFDCDYQTLCMADMLGNVDRDSIIKKDYLQKISGSEEVK